MRAISERVISRARTEASYCVWHAEGAMGSTPGTGVS